MEEKKESYHKFASHFGEHFTERICKFDEEARSYVLAIVNNSEGFKTLDNYGRNSEYFTFTYNGILTTVVCDPNSRVIVTVVKETHNRPQFQGK